MMDESCRPLKHQLGLDTVEYIVAVVLVAVCVVALFWIVSKTVGSFTAVKNSATLDEVAQLLNPELAEGSKRIDGSSRARSKEQYARLAENLSQEVRHEADSGHKIEAVKLYMNESGESLMEAKKIVEAYLERQPFDT